MDYGREAYASASPSIFQPLNPFHNEALRIYTGALRSTPVLSLYAESEPPLESHYGCLNLSQ